METERQSYNMKKHFIIFVVLITTLCSCVKHTEITYESIDLTDSFWMAYKVDNKELSKDELFMFYFSKSQSLEILYLNPDNNRYEPKYSFYYSDFSNNSSYIVEGYYLQSKKFNEGLLHYKKLGSINNMEFKIRLTPESDFITIKMNRLEKVNK